MVEHLSLAEFRSTGPHADALREVSALLWARNCDSLRGESPSMGDVALGASILIADLDVCAEIAAELNTAFAADRQELTGVDGVFYVLNEMGQPGSRGQLAEAPDGTGEENQLVSSTADGGVVVRSLDVVATHRDTGPWPLSLVRFDNEAPPQGGFA